MKIKAGRRSALGRWRPFPYPNELALKRRPKPTPGVPFTVRVFSYDEKGKRKPAAGAKVTGATAPTGADGRATVTLTKPTELIATPRQGHPLHARGGLRRGQVPQSR